MDDDGAGAPVLHRRAVAGVLAHVLIASFEFQSLRRAESALNCRLCADQCNMSSAASLPRLLFHEAPGASQPMLLALVVLKIDDGQQCSMLLLAVQIASAVAQLHECGYVHRDLRPESLLWVPAKAEWCLVNFGSSAKHGAHPLRGIGCVHQLALRRQHAHGPACTFSGGHVGSSKCVCVQSYSGTQQFLHAFCT